jgi:hypothetical protein
MAENPPDEGASSPQGQTPPTTGPEKPEGSTSPGGERSADLVSWDKPSPDTPVVKKGRKAGKLRRLQRGWLLAVVLGLLIVTIVVDFAGAAFLDGLAWARLQPEVKDVRTYLFAAGSTALGFYFAQTRRRGE